LQITITLPWRRMTLQWSQMGLTLGLTFMMFLFAVFAGRARMPGALLLDRPSGSGRRCGRG
jgi:hypothetical protein